MGGADGPAPSGLSEYYRLLVGSDLERDAGVLRLALALGGAVLARASCGAVSSAADLAACVGEIPLYRLFYEELGLDDRLVAEASRLVGGAAGRGPVERLYYAVRDEAARRRLGAFFTEPGTARLMAGSVGRAAREGPVRSVLDPTVGGGTLLAASLEALSGGGPPPDVLLRGVDVDPAALLLAYANVAHAAWRAGAADALSWARRNLRLSWNDYVLRYRVEGPLGPLADVGDLDGTFDAVVANPPWVHVNVYGRERSMAYLSRVPRELTRTLDEVLGGGPGGVRWPEISKSQPPIALAFLYYMLRQFERVATVLVTGTVLKSWNTAGLRLWLAESFDLGVTEVYCKYMEETTSWPAILEARRGRGAGRVEYRVVVCRGESRAEFAASVGRDYLSPLTHPLAAGPWATPLADGGLLRDVAEASRGLRRVGELYGIYRGVNTNAEDVFVFRDARDAGGGLARAVSAGGQEVTLEKELLHAFVRGETLRGLARGRYEFILLPHGADMRPLPEDELRRDYPHAYRWLAAHRERLERRSRSPRPWYRVMDVSAEKVRGRRVAWRKHAVLLEFVELPERVDTPIGERLVVPDGTVYFLRAEGRQPDLRSLNHPVLKAAAWMTAKPKGGFPYREYYGWHVALLPYDGGSGALDEVYERHRAEVDRLLRYLSSA